MNRFPISDYVKFTCWTSVTLILWGVIAGVIQSKFETWFAFVFFCVVGVLTMAATWDVKK